MSSMFKDKFRFKIGDRVAVSYLADSRGTIVEVRAALIKGKTEKRYKIIFDNDNFNKLNLDYGEEFIYKLNKYDELDY